MIISFTLENWMSFRDPVTFSMVATTERRHGGRIPKLRKYGTRVLPIAAIYGGNASGKSNFFKALAFAKLFVTNITQLNEPIFVIPFYLDADKAAKPVRFAFELLIDETIYEFSFSVTRTAVVEEKLVKITDDKEEVLYTRPGKPVDSSLQIVFDGTRENQLFLTNSVSQKVSAFRPVYNWFYNKLMLIAPDWSSWNFQMLFEEKNSLCSHMNELLSQLDTGIVHLKTEEISFESAPLSESQRRLLQEDGLVEEGLSIRIPGESVLISRQGGKLIAKKLVSSHLKADATNIKFEIYQESDGTRRVIDLLPALLDLSDQTSKLVYVIDEIDRSLHTLLTKRLIEGYLASCSATTRSQLLLTTHDVLLMDKQLLRHDEMWVAERDASGASTLYSFSEYKDAAKDKDIRKSYLQGRLGGIPRLLLNGPLRQCKSEEVE